MPQLLLVTGGAGFIGSHLCDLLLARGYAVRVLDDLSSGRAEWVPDEAELMRGDVRDPEACRAACAGAAGVFHMAAMSRSGPSLTACEVCTAQNIIGTQNILLAAREAGVRKMVYSGSSTFYGNRPPPHREADAADPLNFYAASKLAGEHLTLCFDRAMGLPGVVLRYFNVYGPRQPQVGAYALVLGIFLKRWRDGQPLAIHGGGAQTRDFVHVRDVARANLAAFESEAHGVAINVGSGSAVSIKELADLISPHQAHEPARAGDAAATLADITRARSLLGWEPRVPFADGLAEMKARVANGLE